MPGIYQAEDTGPTASVLNLRRYGKMPFTQPLVITLANGERVVLDEYPANLAQMAETVGGSGVTESLLASLESLTAQLQAQGELTEDQANLLKELSDQGHRIAQIEALVEQLAASSGNDKNIFRNARTTFEGVNYNPANLSDLIGVYSSTPASTAQAQTIPPELIPYFNRLFRNSNSLQESSQRYAGREFVSFLAAFKAADDMRAFDNPQIRAVVADLSGKITRLASQMEDQVNATKGIGNPATGDDYSQYTPDRFRLDYAARLTHENSAGICAAGGSRDSGISCPG